MAKRAMKKRPDIPPDEHPIERRDFIVPTIPILEVLEVVQRWIDNRTPGGMIHGKQRFGKTRALIFLQKALSEMFTPTIPMFRHNCITYTRPSDDTFYRDLLDSMNHALFKAGKASDKRKRLIELLLEAADRSRQNRVILFMDDAQELQTLHYDWLMNVGNALDKQGVALTTLLFGQPELINVRSALRQQRKNQIIGRFMAEDHPFRGLETVDDVCAVLGAYDDAEYPSGSGCSYVEFYYPAAFACGFRLRNEAELVFRAFGDAHERYRLTGKFEIPMEHFTLAVRYILRTFGRADEPIASLTLNQWNEAIRNAGYTEAAEYLQPPENLKKRRKGERGDDSRTGRA